MLIQGLLIISAVFSAGAELHVAPAGNDANDGSQSAPFATLPRAREAVKSIKAQGLPEGGVAVIVHAGEYAFTEPFALTQDDSGSEAKPVIYRAAGETILHGGHVLPATSFTPVTHPEMAARIPETSRASVQTVDLKALGITELGTIPDNFEGAVLVPELFYNGARMELARWPNEGWAEMAKVIDSGPAPWRNHTSDATGTFEYSGDQPARWVNAPAVWIEGYWCFDWASATIRVGMIDPEKRHITLAVPHHYGIGSGNPAPRRFRAVNLLDELDSAGEYFIERENGTLYFFPPGPLEGARVVLSTLTQPVIQLTNAEHVSFEGFTVETTAGHGIQIDSGAYVTVAGCTVRNTGQEGIVVNGGEAHMVRSCNLYDIGTTGLRIGGGDRKTLTPSRHEVINNHIHHVSRRMRTHAYNISLSGVGVRLAHNEISDAPHQAIMTAGNNHLFEFNEIHRVGMESDDSGAFYMGRNPSERGTVLRYNYWHDLGSKMAHGSCAVYFDDGAGGQTVFGNVFRKASGGQFGAVFSHGGHDNLVANNLFIDCARAIGSSPWPAALWNQWLNEPLWQKNLLEEVDVTGPVYLDQYPELANYMTPGEKLRLNHAERNIVVRCDSYTNGNWSVRDSVSVTVDPGFVDAEAGNYALRDDAAILGAVPGFAPVPFDRMGTYADDFRKNP